jgi:hypothetical protein
MKALDVYDQLKNNPALQSRIEKVLDNKPADEELFNRWA